MGKNYSFFSHQKCEYFPCHKGADPDNFNCLFCYCPLYALGRRCGGQFVYRSNGCKDCSNCTYPHLRQNYDAIIERYQEILDLTLQQDGKLQDDEEHLKSPAPDVKK